MTFLVSQLPSQSLVISILTSPVGGWGSQQLVAPFCVGRSGFSWGWPWLGQLCLDLASPPLSLPFVVRAARVPAGDPSHRGVGQLLAPSL